MKIRSQTIIVGLTLTVLSCMAFTADQLPQSSANRSSSTFSTVFEIVNPGGVFSSLGDQVDATTVLTRRKDGVAMSFNSKGLLPNAPYTAWWVVFNKPKHCETPCECGFTDVFDPARAAKAKTAVFWATGRVTDSYGQGVFSAQVGRKQLPTGEDQVVFGPGLKKTDAEIHLVTRAHGPALGTDPELEEQLTQFNGGCNDECFDAQVSVHRSPTCKAK